MLDTSIAAILAFSGAVTAGGGLAAFLFPREILRLVFGVESYDGTTMFFVRHWGVLIFVVGALLVENAYAPAGRTPILAAAAIEKFAVVVLIFFGPMRRTSLMTLAAVADGVFALVYLAYIVGV